MKKTKLLACLMTAILACPFGVGMVSASAETWATNFKGIITEEEGNAVYKNYYINKNEWVIGDSDTVVPYPENGYVLEKAYRAADIPLAVYGKEGCEHHPHGLEDPTPILDFIQKWAV